jgi:hypothetical protein
MAPVNTHSFIGNAHMARLCICLRIHSNSLNAHSFCCKHYPAGDLASIGDQYFLKHHMLSRFII